MKKKGSVCDYSRERNDALVKSFRRCLSRAKVIDLPAIFREVSESPAERFYVSEMRAAVVIRRHLKDGVWIVKGKERLEMFQEIENRVLFLISEGKGLSLADAVFEAVNSPAPRFYLTPRSCRTLIYEHIKRI